MEMLLNICPRCLKLDFNNLCLSLKNYIYKTGEKKKKSLKGCVCVYTYLNKFNKEA